MSNYIIAYHGSLQSEGPEADAAGMAKFMAWIGGLGEAVVNPGTPLIGARIVRPGGAIEEASPEVLNGFSVVKAASFEAALAMAQACPYLEKGPVQVAEMMDMGGAQT